jgi:hypothetical protein
MKYTADVKGGLFSQYAGVLTSIEPGILDYHLRRAAQELDNKGEFVFRKLVDTLLGQAPGANATLTYPEIAASPELGGVRPVNNVTLINRNTTAQDVTDIKTALTNFTTNTTMASPFNGDRNPLGSR